jgi:hypothetical protein
VLFRSESDKNPRVGGATEQIRKVRTIGHQPTDLEKLGRVVQLVSKQSKVANRIAIGSDLIDKLC